MNVTPPVAKDPVAHYLVGEREGHDDKAEEKVRDGERSDEPVLDVLERLLRRDGDDDQHVAHHDHDHEHSDDDGCQDDVG